MKRTSATYRLLSLLAIIFIMAGTTGFVVSSHTCSSCGVHEAKVSVFGASAGQGHVCGQSTEGISSCCSSVPVHAEKNCCQPSGETSQTEGHSDIPGSCASIGGEPCCEYETGLITIDTFSSEKNRTVVPAVDSYIALTGQTFTITAEPAPAVTQLHDRHGGAQHDITRLICCYRL